MEEPSSEKCDICVALVRKILLKCDSGRSVWVDTHRHTMKRENACFG